MFSGVVERWNALAADAGWPVCRELTPKRRKRLDQLWADGKAADLDAAITRAGNSTWLRERADAPPTFDRLLDTNFRVPLLEGSCDDRGHRGGREVASFPVRTEPPVVVLPGEGAAERALRERLRCELGDRTYASWLVPVRLRLTAGGLAVEAASAFAAGYLRDHHGGVLARCAGVRVSVTHSGERRAA